MTSCGQFRTFLLFSLFPETPKMPQDAENGFRTTPNDLWRPNQNIFIIFAFSRNAESPTGNPPELVTNAYFQYLSTPLFPRVLGSADTPMMT